MYRSRHPVLPLALLAALGGPSAWANSALWHNPSNRAVLLVPHLARKNVTVQVLRAQFGCELPPVKVDFSTGARPRIPVGTQGSVELHVVEDKAGGQSGAWSEVAFDVVTATKALEEDPTGEVEPGPTLGTIRLRPVFQGPTAPRSNPSDSKPFTHNTSGSWLGRRLSRTTSTSSVVSNSRRPASPGFQFKVGRPSLDGSDLALLDRAPSRLDLPLLEEAPQPSSAGLQVAELAMTCEPGPNITSEELQFVMIESNEWQLEDKVTQPGAQPCCTDGCCVIL